MNLSVLDIRGEPFFVWRSRRWGEAEIARLMFLHCCASTRRAPTGSRFQSILALQAPLVIDCVLALLVPPPPRGRQRRPRGRQGTSRATRSPAGCPIPLHKRRKSLDIGCHDPLFSPSRALPPIPPEQYRTSLRLAKQGRQPVTHHGFMLSVLAAFGCDGVLMVCTMRF